jgi:phosphatidylserine/phosphatidylglycerophosphate/cardiolipin synthase-like enzyme
MEGAAGGLHKRTGVHAERSLPGGVVKRGRLGRLLARARSSAPQEGLASMQGAERRRSLWGRCGVSPQRREPADGCSSAGRSREETPPALRILLSWFRSYLGKQAFGAVERSKRMWTVIRRLAGMRTLRFVRRTLAVLLFSPLHPFVVGQSPVPCVSSAHAIVLYAPDSNLEQSELKMLRTAKVSVDVAMYSFTDQEIAEELVRLAHTGIRVRVYRDAREVLQEEKRGSSTTATLLTGGAEVRVKGSQDLMHFKSFLIDGLLLRTGSANWSLTGLKRQDNDVHYEADAAQATLFETHFQTMWKRPNNRRFRR